MFTRRGQSIVEYTIIVGAVAMMLYYMGTGVKRGVQGLIKVTADQVGNQQNSDQDFNDSQQGYMVSSSTLTNEVNNKQTNEIGSTSSSGNTMYVTNTSFEDLTNTMTNTITNGGFQQDQ